MKKFNNEILKKETKKMTNYLIGGLSLIVLTILLCVIANYDITKKEKESAYLNDVIEKQNNKTDVKANLKVFYEPFTFAKYDDEEYRAFYIVSDDKYFYIAYMDNSLYYELKDKDLKKNPENIYGITKSISTDVKKLAIEAYNEGLDEDKQITLDDFNDYFGSVYLDTTVDISDTATILYLLSILTTIFALAFLIVYGVKKVKTNKTLKKLDDEELAKIEKEMEDKESFHYEKAHLILTKNYIISFNDGFTIQNYKDVIWIYERKIRQYGITTRKGIETMDKHGKKHTIVELDGVTKKSNNIINEIMETIINNNKDILVGFTKENQKQAKEKIEK